MDMSVRNDKLIAEIAMLKAGNATLSAENIALKTELAEMRAQLSWLTEQISSNKRKMFGSSSEQTAYADGASQLGFFADNALNIHVFDNTNKQAPDATPPKKNRPIKSGEMMSRLPDNIEVETIEHKLGDDELNCPNNCDEPDVHSIGKEVVRRELKIIPASVKIVEHTLYTYSCRNCEQNSDDTPPPFIKPDLPPKVIKGRHVPRRPLRILLLKNA